MSVEEQTACTTQAISIVLLEDDERIREFIAKSLKECVDFTLLGAAGSLSEARAIFKNSSPDVFVSDLNLPDGSAIELIREVRKTSPQTEIVVISVLNDERSVLKAVRAGASGYILKDARPIEIIKVIRDLKDGYSPISPSIARHIIRQTQASPEPAPQTPAPSLTAREMDILWGIAKGFTYNDIAGSLEISHNTVQSHIKNIYRKLEVNSRSEAIYTAVAMKLIELS